jgi:hypothetical protein
VQLAVNKITWQKAGGATEPGRYLLSFGWLTITAEDLVVWQHYPNAVFTLIEMPAASDAGGEFRLGVFELGENLQLAGR